MNLVRGFCMLGFGVATVAAVACEEVDDPLFDPFVGSDAAPVDGAASTSGTSGSGRDATAAEGGASSGGGNGSSEAGASSGGADVCETLQCGNNARCDSTQGSCRCVPGFTDSGDGNCVAPPPGSPLSHSEAEVCQRWGQAHQSAGAGWSAGSVECSSGTLTRAALDEAVGRINVFRWMLGMSPVVDKQDAHAQAMACATVGAWNPPGVVPNPHNPPTSARCYSAEAAAGASTSNMAWGSGSAANAMNQWVEDAGAGNRTALGHRRWLLSPSLGATAIGYYGGGGQYGNASCMGTFGVTAAGQTGEHARPEWFSFPPEGFVPAQLLRWTWSVHLRDGSGQASQGEMVVTRDGDPTPLGMTKQTLSGNYGPGYSAVSFIPNGWQPQAGSTYHVSFSGNGLTARTWDVRATGCN